MSLAGNKLLILQHSNKTQSGGATLNIVPIGLVGGQGLLTLGKGCRLFLTGICLLTNGT